MADFVYVILHVASIVAALLAGFLWIRSASVEVPDLAPYFIQETDPDHTGRQAMRDMAADLERHRRALQKQTRFNKAAARAASAAAVAQAATFALNLMAVVAKAV